MSGLSATLLNLTVGINPRADFTILYMYYSYRLAYRMRIITKSRMIVRQSKTTYTYPRTPHIHTCIQGTKYRRAIAPP